MAAYVLAVVSTAVVCIVDMYRCEALILIILGEQIRQKLSCWDDGGSRLNFSQSHQVIFHTRCTT